MDIYEPHGNHKPKIYKNTQKIKRKELKQNTEEDQQAKRKEIKRRKKQRRTSNPPQKPQNQLTKMII